MKKENSVSERADFCVSTEGNDAWSGRLVEANESRTDGPFATLAKARDAVRDLKDQERRDLLVHVRGGEYSLDDTVVFGPEDSQRQGFTVRYAAYPEEEPVFSAGV
ncbi:right-handed parallel beta-helix repeat-containing protein, partial [bacterium]|nr:right-handed parallel beta-helix repeat-containing protein [bacterium]